MKKEVKFTDAIGKRLENVAFSNEQVVLVFDDNTFSTIGLDKGYDNDVDLIEDSLELLNFSHEKLLQIGIVSKEELEKLIMAQDEKYKEFHRKRDLAEYERIKKRLGL
mgnify:CR=1 FL=1